MKKLIYPVIISLLLLVIVFQFNLNKKNISEQKSTYPDIYNYLDSITYENFKLNTKTEFFYIGRPTCTDCDIFEKDFIKVLKEKKLKRDIKYMNVSKLKKNDKEWNFFTEKYHIKYTPTLALFADGKLIDKIEWTPEKGLNITDVTAWLKKHNVL